MTKQNGNTGWAFMLLLILLACVFAFSAVANESQKIISSDMYVGTGFTPHVMHEVPVGQSQEDGYLLMGIGCMHTVKGSSIFTNDEGGPNELLGNAQVTGTECVPFTQAPLLPRIMDSVPSELLKVDNQIKGNDLSKFNAIALCNFEGYYYTAFLPITNNEGEITGIVEQVVGIMITDKTCTELIDV